VLWHCWLGGRKGIRPVRKWGDGGGGHRLVQMEWRPAGWSVCLPLLIFPCTIKSRSSLLALAHPGSPGKRAIKRLWCGMVVIKLKIVFISTICFIFRWVVFMQKPCEKIQHWKVWDQNAEVENAIKVTLHVNLAVLMFCKCMWVMSFVLLYLCNWEVVLIATWLFSYDPREDKWTVLAEMGTARALAGCTVYQKKIYVIGTLIFLLSFYTDYC